MGLLKSSKKPARVTYKYECSIRGFKFNHDFAIMLYIESEASDEDDDDDNTGVIIGAVVGGTLLFILVVLVLFIVIYVLFHHRTQGE